MGRNRDTGLFVGLIVSLTLHAALAYASIVASVGGRLGADPNAAGPPLELVETPPPPPPPEEERTIRLGIDDSDAVTATWLGGPEDLAPTGALSTVDQAATALPFGERPGPFAIAQAPSPAMPTQTDASEPTPEQEHASDAPPLPSARTTLEHAPTHDALEAPTDDPLLDVPADAHADGASDEQSRDEMLDEARRLLAEAASLLEVIAAAPPPPPPSSRPPDAPLSPEAFDEAREQSNEGAPTLDEPSPSARPEVSTFEDASTLGAEPSDSAGATNDPAEGEIADTESDGARTREEFVTEPGKPLAAKGMEIKTVRPRWSHYTLITSNPRNALVRLRFNREGRVIDAQIVESSGRPDVDRPLLAAMYDWRASGAPLRELPPDVEGEEPHSIEVHFRVVLRR